MLTLTALVLMLKVPDACPAGMMMLVGTMAALLPLESEMVAPPEGAAAYNFTVPCEELPPCTVEGEREMLDKYGLTVSVVD